jgi:dTDP-glucose 4,6-dehydratase
LTFLLGFEVVTEVICRDTQLVRIFNTFGLRLSPGEGRVDSNFMMQALRGEPLTIYGDGSQTRSSCYVDDLIGSILRFSRCNEHIPVNIDNLNELTILQCAEAVLAATGSQSELCFEPLQVDHPARHCPDIAKARTLLGWEPRIPLQQGLARSLGFFRGKVEEKPLPMAPSYAV